MPYSASQAWPDQVIAFAVFIAVAALATLLLTIYLLVKIREKGK